MAGVLTTCNIKHEETAFTPIREVPFTDVHFTDDFWAPRIETNRLVSIPSAFHQCEINGRFDNFALAGGLIKGEHKGDFSFDDTDPYKIIEGASYSLAVKYDPKLDAYLDSVITLIAAAQEPDGYLTTCVTNKCERLSGWWGSSRWEKINSHELYNSGHLYEAAVAHYKATGKRSLLDVALKNADLVCEVFGLGEGQIKYPSGHPIIEMALVKLYNVTGEQKYLDQARYFVDEAGRLSNGRKPGIYSQDHKPVLEQDEIVGHAVRAGYFYSGVTDVAVLQEDQELLNAVKRVWDNMAGKKLYIIGGIGSRPQGEGFGPDYELNNFNNYCETCASIANVYWNHRMFLATGASQYADVVERALYNGVIAGVSLSGDKFFYDNPMASDGVHEREEWFGCACCPGNVTRFMASVPGYAYATNPTGIFVNLYAEGNATVKWKDTEVSLLQQTRYPWDGSVDITVNPAASTRFSLMLRIPGWTTDNPVSSGLYSYIDHTKPSVKIAVNGKVVKQTLQNGYAVIEREWKAGDKVGLSLEMPVRRMMASRQVSYDKGLLSMERGPIVYALEGVDQPKGYVFDIVIPRETTVEAHYNPDLLNGIVVLSGDAFTVEKGLDNFEQTKKPFTFKAIPYSAWNNRGKSQLVVWIPENAERAIVQPEPTLASKATMIGGWGFNDQFEPSSSADINTPYHYWWLKSGTEESIGYQFDKPETVSGVEVYWLAFEHYDVIYKEPESWKLLYKDGNTWTEVKNASPYGTAINQYNKVTFDPVTTTELKLVAQLQRPEGERAPEEKGPQVADVTRKGYSGGVIEWKINE
ncbi:MAG: glycoside hydrolase family 127 protein [Tannerellaceae bacterium]|nr:glycoside hydrolase family 127 protein [Tannerellaceae bacterium]